MATTVRRVGAAGLVLGLCFGAVSMIPASASVDAPVSGLLGGVDGGLLGGLVSGLLQGEGGIFGHEGGVLAGDDELGDVVEGFGSEDDALLGGGLEIVGAVQDAVGEGNIGGEGSFAGPTVGGGVLGGVLGGLLGGGTGLLGGVF
jgi:hypothetical protein